MRAKGLLFLETASSGVAEKVFFRGRGVLNRALSRDRLCTAGDRASPRPCLPRPPENTGRCRGVDASRHHLHPGTQPGRKSEKAGLMKGKEG